MHISDLTFKYDRAEMIRRTREAPEWLHFGAGNIFRAFPCALAEKLLASGDITKGIIAAEGFDTEIIDRIYRPYDNVSMLVTLKGNGETESLPIGSVAESLDVSEDADRLYEIMTSPSLRLVTFTITEKGYGVRDSKGSLSYAVAGDISNPPSESKTFLGRLTYLLLARYNSGKLPLSLLSLDNCSGNGDKLKAAVLTFASAWEDGGFVTDDFISYLKNEEKIAFPCSMIDKITPRPDARVAAILNEKGFEDTETIETAKHTFIAPFVNAEAPQYLVAEDKFPAGRIPLDLAGVIFTDRETVDKAEKMKVCTCLNPLHTSLAVFGCLLGYTLICDEMRDPALSSLVNRLGYVEGLPVVVDPGIISPKAFIDEVTKVRLPNPFMPDSPQRIATDTSQKLSVRFGETIKAYVARGLDMESLIAIPLVAAGWCRYLLAVDDGGNKFTPSSDPLLDECSRHLDGIFLGAPLTDAELHEKLSPILSNANIFGVDLYTTPIGTRAEGYFKRMVSGAGAVRSVLESEIM